MDRRRLKDLYAVPFFVAVLASAIWWVVTENIWLGVSSLGGILLISWVLWRTSPFLTKLQRIRSSELLAIYDNQEQAESDILDALATAHTLDILTIRGLGVIGLNDSLLRRPVQTTSHQRLRIRVLMLDAQSPAVAQRAGEVGESIDAFLHGISLAVERLRELARAGVHTVEVYSYQRLPAWRCIAIDDDLYVSVFGEAVEGHQSPMYRIDAKRHLTLGIGFKRVFEEMCSSGTRIV